MCFRRGMVQQSPLHARVPWYIPAVSSATRKLLDKITVDNRVHSNNPVMSAVRLDFGKPTRGFGTVVKTNEDDALVKWDDDGRMRLRKPWLKKVSNKVHPLPKPASP
jgi:hypothetical protein